MVYYLDHVAGGSWADPTLAALGYDSCPETLQLVIRTLYRKISEKGFRVDGVDVRPFALFEVLDGKVSGIQSGIHQVQHSWCNKQQLVQIYSL
jgi:hypothetical protein